MLLAVLWTLPFALAAYAVSPNLATAAVAIFFVGLIYLGALSSFMSIAQIRAPAAIRGRVVSILAVVLGVLYPLGALIQGRLADLVGLRTVTAAAAALMLLALVVMRARNPRFADALEEPPAPVHPGELAGASGAGPSAGSVDGIPIPSADPI